MKKYIVILLTLIMVFELVPAAAYAASFEAKASKPFKIATLGDSITAGFSKDVDEPDFGNPLAYGQATAQFCNPRCYTRLLAGKIAEALTGNKDDVYKYTKWYYEQLPPVVDGNTRTEYHEFQKSEVVPYAQLRDGVLYRVNLGKIIRDEYLDMNIPDPGDEPSDIIVIRNGYAAHIGGEYVKVDLRGKETPNGRYFATVQMDGEKAARDNQGKLLYNRAWGSPKESAVDYANLAVSGAKTQDIADLFFKDNVCSDMCRTAIGSIPGFQRLLKAEVANADLITVLIGANDIIDMITDVPFLFMENELVSHIISLLSKEDSVTEDDIAQLAEAARQSEFKLDAKAVIDFLRDFDSAFNFNKKIDKVLTSYRAFIEEMLSKDSPYRDKAIALIGMIKPFGNSIEYNDNRYTLPEFLFAALKLLSEKDKTVENFEKALSRLGEVISSLEYIDTSVFMSMLPEFDGAFSFIPPEVLYLLAYRLTDAVLNPLFERYNAGVKKIADDYGLMYIETAEAVSNKRFNFDPHPAKAGHRGLANIIAANVISDIEYDSNFKLAFAGKNNPKQAIYGQTVTVELPLGTKYVTVNGKKYTKGLTNKISFKITEPETKVYAHCVSLSSALSPSFSLEIDNQEFRFLKSYADKVCEKVFGYGIDTLAKKEAAINTVSLALSALTNQKLTKTEFTVRLIESFISRPLSNVELLELRSVSDKGLIRVAFSEALEELKGDIIEKAETIDKLDSNAIVKVRKLKNPLPLGLKIADFFDFSEMLSDAISDANAFLRDFCKQQRKVGNTWLFL